MATKRIVKTLRMTDSLKSDVNGLSYPVDALKELYIKSGRSAERIAKMYGISLKLLLEYAEAGEWDRLKEQHEKTIFNTILKLRSESFVNSLTGDQREQMFESFQRDQYMDEVEEHFRKYGHLFCVDADGEILRDKTSGLPIKMKFMTHKEDILRRRELQGSIELNLKLLAQDQVEKPQILKEEPKKIKGKSIDVESYLEEDDDD